MAGRTVLVTGPTSGLGRAATEALAALGARVVLVGRSPNRLALLRDSLVREHAEDRFPMVVADMGSLRSVREAASQVLATEPRLDVLVDNAGAIFPERTIGPDGIEATLATLVVGPFALEAALLPLMARTPGSRIVSVTSGGMYTQPVHLDDLQYESEPWSGSRAYARAKRIQVTVMREWDRRLAEAGVAGVGGHSGTGGGPSGLLPPHAPDSAHPGRRGRHDRLAGNAPDSRRRQALPRPATTAFRPRSEHQAQGSRPASVVERRSGAVRIARSHARLTAIASRPSHPAAQCGQAPPPITSHESTNGTFRSPASLRILSSHRPDHRRLLAPCERDWRLATKAQRCTCPI